MKSLLPVVMIVAVAIGTAYAVPPPDLINYQGVLRDASDNPLDGSYGMVFRLYSASAGGDEIVVDTHAAVTVSGGLFSVTIGGASAGGTGVVTDGSGPGSYIYIPRVFADYSDVYLEVEVQGEVLSPRTRIVSAPSALNSRFVNGIDVAAPGPLDLYVNDVTGDDTNSGMSSGAPKKTIQAAVDRVPAILTGQVTIHIADGFYSEEIYIPNQVIKDGHSIVLVGNVTAPENVVLTGNGILETGIATFGIGKVRGLTVTDFTEAGIEIALGDLGVRDCRVTDNGEVGIRIHDAGAEIKDTVVENNTGAGITLSAGGSTAYINGSQINGNGSFGIAVTAGSHVIVEGSLVIQGNGDIGVLSMDGSSVDFSDRADVTIQFNTNADMLALYHSTIRNYGSGTTGSCVEADTHSMCDP